MAFSLGYEFFIFAIGLILPRIIILSYGDAVNGLTQTITRLLTLINLIQAGAVGASIYQMYKPVADGDYKTQSEILYASRKYYSRLGVIYLVIAALISIPYGFYLAEDDLSAIEIILSFLILAVNGSIHFFFTSRYDIFFSSHQKRYILTISSFAERIAYYVVLFLVVSGNLHFICMYIAHLFGGVARTVVNEIYYRKLSKGKIDPNPENKNYKIKDRKNLMLNSIGTEMITAAPTVIITTFIGLAYSSVFSVYALIYTSMKTIINSVQLSVSAIFGNLVAKAKDEKIARVFNILVYIFISTGALLASCTAFMIMPFINIYTKGFDSLDYKVPVLAIFVVAYIVIFSVRIVYAFVSTVYGLFKEMCKLTLTLGAVGVAISTIATILFGMPYVMVGVLLFHASYTVSLLLIFKKRIPWFTLKKLPVRLIFLCLMPTISFALYYMDIVKIASFAQWAVVAVIFALIVCCVLLAYSLIYERKEFFALLNYLKKIVTKKKKSNA